MSRPLHLCYLLESTELSGGVRVVLDQARALALRGHAVTILTRRGDAAWYPYSVKLVCVEDLVVATRALQPDVVIATFWTTVAPAVLCNAPLTVHLCQGLEWECPEYAAIAGQIEAAYQQPLPKLTVGPWLDDKLRLRFGARAFAIACVGQCVDTGMYRPSSPWQDWRTRWRRWRHDPPPSVLIPGMFESSVKGIRLALAAVARLRVQGRRLHVIRVSSLPQHVGEAAITAIDEYHEAVTPGDMVALYRRAAVVMTPSFSGEGFGLPFAEALACGAAVVATRIPSYTSLATAQDYACLVPEGDVDALTAALAELLDHPARRRRMGRRGARLLRQAHAASAVAARIEQALEGWLAATPLPRSADV